MKILPLAKIAAARKRLIEQTKEMKMPIDVEALEKQADAIAPDIYEEFVAEFARLILEEAAKACDEKVALANPEAEFNLGYSSACVDCATAIRALKP